MDAASATECRRQRLRVGPRIGVGGYSTVYAAIDEVTNEQVAVKLLGPRNRFSTTLRRELLALEELGDLPHIVRMHRHFACGCARLILLFPSQWIRNANLMSPPAGPHQRRAMSS